MIQNRTTCSDENETEITQQNTLAVLLDKTTEPIGALPVIEDITQGGCAGHEELNTHGVELVKSITHENQTPMTLPHPMSFSNEKGLSHGYQSPMSSDEIDTSSDLNTENDNLLDIIIWDHDPFKKTKNLDDKRGPSDWTMFSGYLKVKGMEFDIKLIPLTGIANHLLKNNRKKNAYDVLQNQIVMLLDFLVNQEDHYMEHPEECPFFISFIKIKNGKAKKWNSIVIF